MKSLDEISFFLHCGYLPTYKKDDLFHSLFKDNSGELKRNPDDFFTEEAIAIDAGAKLLRSLFKDVEDGLHVIPLSGGLDSRTIVAGLVEQGLKDQMMTVTFGIPGTENFEIGSFIAEKFKLPHKAIDLRSVPISSDKLMQIAINGSSWTFLFDAYYNFLIPKEFGEEATYWSGFPGLGLSGRVYYPFESPSWEEVLRLFMQITRFQQSIDLTQPGYDPIRSLPQEPFLDKSILSYEDQVNFIIRQQNYTSRVILFDGFNYKTPFFSPTWNEYILRLPHKFRSGSYIIRKILLKIYPDWFLLPNTSTLGASLGISKTHQNLRRMLNGIRRRIDKNPRENFKILDNIWNVFRIYRSLNYVDYNLCIRERDDFKGLVYENLQDLKRRGILYWLDLDDIWDQHQKQSANYGEALLLLAALEINLKFDELGSDSLGL